jgi:hypothetical protein
MKKKPNNVTRFGAIHMGSSSTKPFHCAHVSCCCGRAHADVSYVVLENVAGDEGFVDARVFVRSQVLQRIFRDALVLCSLCIHPHISELRHERPCSGMSVPLLGGMVGWVTGGGSDMDARGAWANLYRKVRGHTSTRDVRRAGNPGAVAVLRCGIDGTTLATRASNFRKARLRRLA